MHFPSTSVVGFTTAPSIFFFHSTVPLLTPRRSSRRLGLLALGVGRRVVEAQHL
jgi:hypothetical protein